MTEEKDKSRRKAKQVKYSIRFFKERLLAFLLKSKIVTTISILKRKSIIIDPTNPAGASKRRK